MSRVLIVARATLLENSRKQVFHVLCIAGLAVISGSTLLSIFTEGVQIKIMKDLCMTSVLLSGAVLAIALGSTGIPNDVESRMIHPVIARPISRVQYVLGKFLGSLVTVALGLLAMCAIFGVLIFSYEHKLDPYLALATGFALIEVAVIAAIATAVSTTAGPAVTAMVTFLVYIAGTVKIGYFGRLVDGAEGLTRVVYKVVYHLLPNLECFNLKSALVHHDPVPAAYLAQVAVYGLLYAAFALTLGALRFARKEV